MLYNFLSPAKWVCKAEDKRRNEFAEWHVAWLAEWHNYAECKIWKMAQRNKLNWKACACLCRAYFWRQFETATALQLHLLLLAQQEKGRAESSGKLYCKTSESTASLSLEERWTITEIRPQSNSVLTDQELHMYNDQECYWPSGGRCSVNHY